MAPRMMSRTLAALVLAGALFPIFEVSAWGQTVMQVSAGGAHTCALKSDGTFAYWGNNEHRHAAPLAGSFTQVSAGEW